MYYLTLTNLTNANNLGQSRLQFVPINLIAPSQENQLSIQKFNITFLQKDL